MKNKFRNLFKRVLRSIDKKKWILIVLLIIIAPFIIQGILIFGPYKADYLSNDSWFSFLGSYVGSIITLLVFKMTIRENKKEFKKQLDLQLINFSINDEIERVDKYMDIVLVNDISIFEPCFEIKELSLYYKKYLSLTARMVSEVFVENGNSSRDKLLSELRNRFKEIADILEIISCPNEDLTQDEAQKSVSECVAKLRKLGAKNFRIQHYYKEYIKECRLKQSQISNEL